jgi:hypothetical protein
LTNWRSWSIEPEIQKYALLQRDIQMNRRSSESRVRRGPMTRVTYIVPEPLDHNIELLCMITGRMKADVYEDALEAFLLSSDVAEPYRDYKEEVKRMRFTHPPTLSK